MEVKCLFHFITIIKHSGYFLVDLGFQFLFIVQPRVLKKLLEVNKALLAFSSAQTNRCEIFVSDHFKLESKARIAHPDKIFPEFF